MAMAHRSRGLGGVPCHAVYSSHIRSSAFGLTVTPSDSIEKARQGGTLDGKWLLPTPFNKLHTDATSFYADLTPT